MIGQSDNGRGAESAPAAGMVPSPLELWREQFTTRIDRLTERLAPGRASVPWELWDEAAPSHDVVPPLLGAGIGEVGDEAIRLLVPGVGLANLSLGKHSLLERAVATPDLSGQPGPEAIKRIKREAQAEADRINRGRLAGLAAERPLAATFASSLAVRAVASAPPGKMRVSLYDPYGAAEPLYDFAPMVDSKLFGVFKPDNLPLALKYLAKYISTIRDNHLHGFKSMRDLARHGGVAPKPWHFVALLGSGEPLNTADQALLEHIARTAPIAGMMVVTHGFRLPAGPPTMHIDFEGQELYAPIGEGVRFIPDGAPPEAIVKSTALYAIGRRPLQITGTDRLANKRLSPAVYAATLVKGAADAAWLAELTAQHESAHPFIQPDTAEAVNRATEDFPRLAAEVSSADRKQLAEITTGISSDNLTPDTLMKAAILRMAGAVPVGHTTIWSKLAAARQAFTLGLPDATLRGLFELVSGPDRLTAHADFLAYAKQFVPETPPAWAYLLVTDAALHTAFGLQRREALTVICNDLHEAFGIGVQRPDGGVNNKALVEALAECRILQLAGFGPERTPLNTMLACRAGRRLQGISEETLPPTARQLRAACLAYLDELRLLKP